MPEPVVTVAIPTLAADDALAACLASLAAQTFSSFEIIVIDNSGQGLVRRHGHASLPRVRVLEMERNVGFGAAINAAVDASASPYLATLNDDAIASPRWLAALVAALEQAPEAGMCASQVRLAEEGLLDSAGMLLCADGSSKQRGHGEPFTRFAAPDKVLLPSASAALYRRAMLERTGAFDADFFLYCEDTDLGLRALRAGWTCVYAPDAQVDHRYSHSAGRVSPLKAWYVERNRLFVAIKNFPPAMLAAVPFVTLVRYGWHVWYLLRGVGTAARFRHSDENSGWTLAWYVVKAHASAIGNLPALLRKRRAIQRDAKMPSADFTRLLRRFRITPRTIAGL